MDRTDQVWEEVSGNDDDRVVLVLDSDGHRHRVLVLTGWQTGTVTAWYEDGGTGPWERYKELERLI